MTPCGLIRDCRFPSSVALMITGARRKGSVRRCSLWCSPDLGPRHAPDSPFLSLGGPQQRAGFRACYVPADRRQRRARGAACPGRLKPPVSTKPFSPGHEVGLKRIAAIGESRRWVHRLPRRRNDRVRNQGNWAPSMARVCGSAKHRFVRRRKRGCESDDRT